MSWINFVKASEESVKQYFLLNNFLSFQNLFTEIMIFLCCCNDYAMNYLYGIYETDCVRFFFKERNTLFGYD